MYIYLTPYTQPVERQNIEKQERRKPEKKKKKKQKKNKKKQKKICSCVLLSSSISRRHTKN